MQKKLESIKTALLMLLLLVSAIMIVFYVMGSKGNKDLNERLLAIHDAAPSQPAPVLQDEGGLEQSDCNMLPEIASLAAINPDCAGWIKIDGTNVNNVVVQTDNNDYYLSHNFNGDFAEAGTIFIDYRCNIDPEMKCNNIIVYGHNQRDGSMFAPLLQFKKDPLSVRNAPTINFSTKYEIINFDIIAFFVVDAGESENKIPFRYYNYINYNEEMFEEFKKEIKSRSLIETDVDFTKDDLLITLSTCCSDYEDARFVVIGKKTDLEDKPTYKRTNR